MKLALRVAIWGAVAAGAIWFINATEWVETEVHDPPRGAAAHDDLYAARKFLPKLGMKVESRTSLDVLPPPGARLLLTSSHWALLKDRPKQLENWVRAGGHLVIPARMLDPVTVTTDKKTLAWLPIGVRDRPRGKPDPNAPAPRPRNGPDADCHNVSDAQEVFRICAWPYWREMVVLGTAHPDWQIRNDTTVEAMRVPYGQGSVTVMGVAVMGNRFLLRADNAQVFANAMQADRGAVAWIVSEEARQRLVPWVLTNGWVAVALVLLAIAAGLWRSAVRFGPIALPATRSHRSMAEQVMGTAHFLQRHGSGALHQAQLRALEEAATRNIAGYAAADAQKRVALIAARTKLREHELADAMRTRFTDRRNRSASLNLMETARRRIEKKDERHADQD